MQHPKVIISVLNWFKYEDTIACINSLQQIDYPNYEIIIVDNNSLNDSVKKIKQNFPRLKLIESKKNLGYAAGHKLSADDAIDKNADLLWMLNSDIKARRNTLTELVRTYRKNNEAIYGSITLKSENPDVISFGGGDDFEDEGQEFSYNIFEDKLLEEYPDELKEREVQTIEGSSMMIPVLVIKKYGFMNCSCFMYGEETIYCYHLRTKNIPSIIVPSSIVVHRCGSSFANTIRMGFIESYYRRRNYLFFRKKYYHWSNQFILKKQGGIKNIIKFFIKYWFLSNKQFKQDNKNLYYINLATLHAMLGIKGKKVYPEKYYT